MFLTNKDDILVILKDVGSILAVLSLLYLIPLFYSILIQEPLELTLTYLISGLLQLVIGFSLWRFIKVDVHTTMKHAFVEITLLWFIYPLLFAYPFVSYLGIGILDAYFEMVSAITTTGLSVMTSYLDTMPLSLIVWRSFVSWIGGIGIVIMALSSFFIKYTKASRMVIAEGRDDKIKLNIKNAARSIFSIYIVLTLIGVGLLYLSGMDLFNSVNYAMSAISTTGMDITSAGLTQISNIWIELSLIIIMILGATSFSLHYLIFKRKEFFRIFQDTEFLFLLCFGFLVAFLNLQKLDLLQTKFFLDSLFHSFSALTCGGFTLISPESFVFQNDFIKASLISAMFIGGAAGSTAGGIKISRAIIFFKSIYWKTKEMIFPKNTIFPKIYEGQQISEGTIKEILQFILLYGLLIMISTIILTYMGIPFLDSLFEVTSAQSNVGISIGLISQANPFIKVLLIINMLLGRLEIIPIFAFLGFILSYRRGE